MQMSSIPDFDENGNLPPGIYDVSLRDIERHFTWTDRRKQLFEGFKRAIANLTKAKVKKVWVDGSFVTSKDDPNDIDGCWQADEYVDADLLDPVFLDMHPPREAMKVKYGVDFLIAGVPIADSPGNTIEEFFQIDRDDNKKGILLFVNKEQS
jgi:hypothetical protein